MDLQHKTSELASLHPSNGKQDLKNAGSNGFLLDTGAGASCGGFDSKNPAEVQQLKWTTFYWSPFLTQPVAISWILNLLVYYNKQHQEIACVLSSKVLYTCVILVRTLLWEKTCKLCFSFGKSMSSWRPLCVSAEDELVPTSDKCCTQSEIKLVREKGWRNIKKSVLCGLI